ncbi:MAG: glycosyltransferase family 4 protein [Deltaproteobacteria bacterium]|nr:glycosyltransferase family 4 protein [Deltaproteobacteria bacterium]
MSNNKYKILLYTHNFPPLTGGPAVETYRFSMLLHGLGHKVFVLAPRYSTGSNFSDGDTGFGVIRMPRRTRSSLRNIFVGFIFLVYAVIKYRPRLIFVMEHEAQVACSIVNLFIPMNIIVRIPGIEIFREIQSGRRRLKHWLFMQLINKSKKIIATSDYDKKVILKSRLKDKNKVILIPPFLSNEWFDKEVDISERDRFRKKYNLDSQHILLTVGRLYPAKGQDAVIKSLPYVLEKIPNIKYLIIGQGRDRDRLTRLVNEMNLDHCVQFLDYISYRDLEKHYDLCDIFILASRDDGVFVDTFGIVFAEANARRKPVIGGKVGGVAGFTIIDGYNGLLVNPTDPYEISRAIMRLIEDKELAYQLGENGRKRTKQLFSEESVAKKLTELIGW